MAADLRRRAVALSELMDADDADLAMLERTYARFPLVNAVVSGWRGLYRREIRPRARRGRIRVLDLGCGGGDITRTIARRLQRDGLDAELVGADIDPRAVRWATEADEQRLVDWRCVSSDELAEAGERFDVVLSNHLLHHLSAARLAALLDDSARLTAPGGVAAHSDIERSRAAYRLFGAATLPFARNVLAGSFIREDGLISIRRSYTAAELAAVAPEGWRVRRGVPARLLLMREAPDARS